MRDGLPGSYEALFHEVSAALDAPTFALVWRDGRPTGAAMPATPAEVVEALRQERQERAIGVIYRPETERYSHYFGARLADQFDAVLHFDQTRAVEPLERTARWQRGESDLPETYPFAV